MIQPKPRAKRPFVTIADLLDRVDGLPLRRIRLDPAPGAATEDDVLRIHLREDRLFELVDGVLVEKTAGLFESCLTLAIAELVGAFVRKHRLGIVTGADGAVRLAPRLVRIPDIAFFSWTRIPGRRLPSEPIPDLAPDLAVEVISKSNTRREMERKLQDYFDAGVRLVWYIYPKNRTARVYRSPDSFATLAQDDVVDGGDVLPGFPVKLREFFDATDLDPQD